MKRILAKTGLCLILSLCLAGALSAENYVISYEMKSDTRKNFIVTDVRMYYHAYADAFFEGVKAADGSMRFTLKDIPNTGVRVRTHRNGEKISLVTAAKNLIQAKSLFGQLETNFRNVPFYGPMIQEVVPRAFLIGDLNPQSFTFTRSALGTHSAIQCRVPMITPPEYGAYDDSFNVYPIMGEILRMFNHDALPAGGIAAAASGKTKTWMSVRIDYTTTLNKLLALADHKAVKYVDFDQEEPFRIYYKTQSNADGVLTVVGSAQPNVSIASGVSIRRCLRTVKYRVSDGLLLEDSYTVDARASNGVGWMFSAAVRLQ
ncbi:MAG: hypothetical protein LBC99_03625 [Spirochaetota bacterium]|jgi:hypothetical protein|nr:hypothetical protein [Spirochaetota bacterium]